MLQFHLPMSLYQVCNTFQYIVIGDFLMAIYYVIKPSVALGKDTYPRDIAEKLRAYVTDVSVVDGLRLAEEAGNPRTVNTVLLGALSRHMEPTHEQWIAAINTLVPEKFREVNLKAFELGRGE